MDEFLRWSHDRGWDVAAAPRAVVTVHSSHLAFQQPKVVDALVRAFEKRGVLTAAIFDLAEDYLQGDYEQQMLAFRPQVVVHTCHSTDSVAFRERLGVPHMHSIFFRAKSIADWRESIEGLAPSEVAFHITGQELLGAIEPQIGAGTRHGGGSDEAFTPIPERIDHLVDRAAAWIRLARLAQCAEESGLRLLRLRPGQVGVDARHGHGNVHERAAEHGQRAETAASARAMASLPCRPMKTSCLPG